MMTLVITLLMGSVVGLVLGVFGSGGSVLAVPILVYVMGIEVKSAIAMSLVIVGITALTGAILQWRQKTFCLKAAVFFSIIGIFGALAGTWLAMYVSPVLQLFIFGIVMVVAAVATMLKKDPETETGQDQCYIRPDLASGLGAGVGVLTGFLGVGGGFLIVPALNSLGNLKLRLAIGTSLFIITVNCAAGVVGYWGKVDFHWPLTFTFVIFSALASLLGVRLGRKLPVPILRKAFSILILLLGIGLIVNNGLLL